MAVGAKKGLGVVIVIGPKAAAKDDGSVLKRREAALERQGGPKGVAETALEKRIGGATGKSYKGKR